MKKILIIEDEIPIKKGIQSILDLNNYKTFTASDGIEGIALAKEIKPDLILCDIMMPGLDGYDVLKAVNSSPSIFNIPFIFITAKASLKDIRAGMQLGADDYVVKPFSAEELIKAVEVRLRKFEQMQKDAASPPAKKKLKAGDKHLVNTGGRPEIIEIDKIIFIEAVGNYSKIIFKDKKLSVRRTVAEWEKLLSEDLFIRIHRSNLINISFIERIDRLTRGAFSIKLKNIEIPLIASRNYSKNLREFLK